MTRRRDAFYTERDRRTRQYGGTDDALESPVLIAVGADVPRQQHQNQDSDPRRVRST